MAVVGGPCGRCGFVDSHDGGVCAACGATSYLASMDMGWHVMSGTLLLDSLRRASAGEDPDVLFAELWANAEHETP